jgi:hypothetical protein
MGGKDKRRRDAFKSWNIHRERRRTCSTIFRWETVNWSPKIFAMKRFLTLVFCTVILPSAFSQDDYKSRIDSQRYTFEAQSMTPQRTGTRQLSSGYTIRVTKDTVMVDLPYMGRAYQAAYGSSEGGIKFTSTDFEYTVAEKKKGGWKIAIKPRDVSNSPRVNLDISTKGFATAYISTTDKTPISYYGTIKK